MGKGENRYPRTLSPLGGFGMWKGESWRSDSLLSGNIMVRQFKSYGNSLLPRYSSFIGFLGMLLGDGR